MARLVNHGWVIIYLAWFCGCFERFGEIILDDHVEATQITWMNAHFF